METFIKAPGRFKFTRTLLAVAAAVAALAAVLLAAGSGHAQTPRHATPEACPGETSRPNDEAAAVVDSGHYALFDVYWNPDEGELTNTVCPPLVTHRIEIVNRKRTEVTDRSASEVDIGQTTFHVRESARETLTTNSQTDYQKYPFLYPDADPGAGTIGAPLSTEIWVLPSCEVDSGSDPATHLCVGFSAGLLRVTDWNGDVEFRFVNVRQPGIAPADRGHAFPFGDDLAPFWVTADTDRNAFAVTAGTYEDLRWVFTKPGTYVFAVQAEGEPAANLGLPAIIGAVTSEVREYTFHVGPLTIDDQPFFQVERSIPEDASANANVGVPIPVGGIGGDTLTYALSGDGSENFSVSSATGGAQIKVADGADLDYETRSVYNLTLSVRDDRDRLSNPDTSIDDRLGVNINVTDVNDSFDVVLFASDISPTVGDEIIFTVTLYNSPVPADQLRYRWTELDQGGGNASIQSGSGQPEPRRITHDTAVTREYTITFWYVNDRGQITDSTDSNTVVVTWSPADG